MADAATTDTTNADTGADGAAASPGGSELTNGGAPAWLGELPDDLKADATLTRYADVPALARAHIEAHKVAKGKLAVPGEGASDEDWGKVWTGLGLPDKADGYGDFGLAALPDDADDAAKEARAAMVGRYQESLHKIGVPPALANKIVAADIDRIQTAERAHYAKGEAEIEALKAELKEQYEPKKEAAKKMFLSLFGPDAAEMADELDSKVGSATLMRGIMKLVEVAGEHVRVDGAGGEAIGGDGDPAAQLSAKFKDRGWREKFNAGDVTAVAEEKRLREAAIQAASRRR